MARALSTEETFLRRLHVEALSAFLPTSLGEWQLVGRVRMPDDEDCHFYRQWPVTAMIKVRLTQRRVVVAPLHISPRYGLVASGLFDYKASWAEIMPADDKAKVWRRDSFAILHPEGILIPLTGLCPICGEAIELVVYRNSMGGWEAGRTTDHRIIGCCEDAFSVDSWLAFEDGQPPEPEDS